MKHDKLIILTAEPSNFVPMKLKEAADSLGLESQIIDIRKTVLLEELKGSSPETFSLESGVFIVEEDGKLTPIKITSTTAIIPRLNEYHVLIKLGIMKRFEKQGAFMLNTTESMELCNDKLMTQVVLNSAGIKTPLSIVIQGINEIEKVVNYMESHEKIKYPFIIKTIRGTHGIGVMKVDSRSSLISVAQLLSKEGIDFMLQEFCKHKQSVRIIMIGDHVLASNLRGQPKEKDEFRTNSHLGSETEKYEPSDEEIAIARRIVELFGCKFCAIDYLITEKKEIIILEVNGSPGLENIQTNWPDKDLAKTVVEYIIGNSESMQAQADTINGNKEIEQVEDEALTIEPTISQNTIGETEIVSVNRIANDLSARVDTGAKYCSLHVDKVEIDGNWVKFTRGDITYKVPVFKMVKIRHASLGESVQRPVVKLDIIMRNIRLNQIEFTLNDRSSMKFEILIGRNALQALGLPVIVYKDEDKSQNDQPESEIYDIEEE